MKKLTMLKIEAGANGGHINQTIFGMTSKTFPIPSGYCVVPDTMLPLENFPYGEAEAELVDGVMTLTKWTAGELPPAPEPEPQEPTEAEILADHETRLTELSDELSAVEDAMCESDEAAAAWRAGIEDALCELDEGGDL